jgi:hypothetical protein
VTIGRRIGMPCLRARACIATCSSRRNWVRRGRNSGEPEHSPALWWRQRFPRMIGSPATGGYCSHGQCRFARARANSRIDRWARSDEAAYFSTRSGMASSPSADTSTVTSALNVGGMIPVRNRCSPARYPAAELVLARRQCGEGEFPRIGNRDCTRRLMSCKLRPLVREQLIEDVALLNLAVDVQFNVHSRRLDQRGLTPPLSICAPVSGGSPLRSRGFRPAGADRITGCGI